ncbi:hypothetical protein SLAVM298S_03443 [Streptomyces lavendulae subsp. lavendulae]
MARVAVGNAPIRRAPAQTAAGLGQVGVGPLQPLQDGIGVPDQVLGGRGEPDRAAGAFQQRQAGLPLQGGELLGDGGGAEGQCLGHGGDGAAAGELPQEPEAAYVEHRPSLRFG